MVYLMFICYSQKIKISRRCFKLHNIFQADLKPDDTEHNDP